MSENSLYIVSNRLPITVSRDDDGAFDIQMSSGGLVSGLRRIHEQSGIHWIGHSGVFENDSGFSDLEAQLAEKRLIPVRLQKKDYNAYYYGISNDAVWPLFHYFPSSMKFSFDDWEGYVKVNQQFAEKVLSMVKPGDRVWVHDYQLMLVPRILRDAGMDLRISYFHHIPFPSSEMFRILPHRDTILRGLLGAEYVGFHTYDYVRHFLSSVARVLGTDIHVDQIHWGNRQVKVAAHPLGVDFEKFNELGQEITRQDQEDGQEPTVQGADYVFLGLDRLDYTKGIPERLMAFREFLRMYPEYVGKVTLVQLCVPSRSELQTYGELRATVERLVGQINGQFSMPGYTPIQYLYRSLPQQEVVRLYKEADAALVTPLRDGLNLVCKEYCAARDDGDGVLILSELAGAATEMGEALKVNPYDTRDVAKKMHEALTMGEVERRRRMQLLRERVKENNNQLWGQAFLDAWDASYETRHVESQKLDGDERKTFIETLRSGRRVFLFLDHDGTLTPLASRPELAIPKPHVLELIKQFTDVPEVVVTLVTGRVREFCEQYFLDLPVNIVAEHGAFVWERGTDTWQGQIGLEEYEELKPDLLKLLGMYSRFVPGSHIENKETGLVWHYRQSEPIFAESQANELIQSLQQMLGNTSLAVFPGKKTVEIRQKTSNKGYAVEHILGVNGYTEEDKLVTVGDDPTDEDMHRVHSDVNMAIHIGQPNVYAKYFLSSPAELYELLKELRAAFVST